MHRKSDDDRWCRPSLWSSFPLVWVHFHNLLLTISITSISVPQHRYELPFFFILFALLCLHTANMKLFKKSSPGNTRSGIDLESCSLFTSEWKSCSIQETSLIGFRSETEWWLYLSAPDTCIVTEECMWQRSFCFKTPISICGHFFVFKGAEMKCVFPPVALIILISTKYILHPLL